MTGVPAEGKAEWIRYQREGSARLERIVAAATDKHRWLLVIMIAVLYLAVTVQLAQAKQIWTDEFFTLFLSRLGLRELWSALLTGGDQHPPPFYLVHHAVFSLFGERPWVLRLPAMTGFLLMIVCVYAFVARRTTPAYGLLAMAMPLVTIAHEYSYEARGYSLLMGWLALAILCWQRAGDRPRRWLPVIGLAVGLLGAVTSHYYSVLLLPALAATEVIRTLRRKSVDGRIWLAMCTPIVPLAVFYPLLHSSSRFAGTFWAQASLSEIHLFYKNVLGTGLACLLCALAVAGLYQMIFGERGKTQDVGSSLPVEEVVLGGALAAAPFAAYLFGKFVTGVFAWRYAIGGIIGLAILFGFFCFRFFRGSRVAALLCLLVIMPYFLLASRVKKHVLTHEVESLKQLTSWLNLRVSGSDPLIIGNSEKFYELSYYGSPAMRQRCVYLVDEKRSAKYLHHDTVERSLWNLNPWFKLNVQPYEPFVREHQSAFVWSGVDPEWNWLTSALIDDGKTLRLLGRVRAGMLFSLGDAAPKSAPVPESAARSNPLISGRESVRLEATSREAPR